MKSCRHKRCGYKFSHVGASFQLALLRQDEILSPQEMWVQVFPCGCKFSTCTSPTRWKSCRHKRGGCEFSHVGASFPTCTSPTRWKSCRHKERWVQVFPCGCEFSTCTTPTRWKSCRHKEMWVQVFPGGCEFSTCTSPTRWKSCRHKRCGYKLSQVGASFQLALPRQDGNLVATKRGGCKFSNLHPARAENIPPILLSRLFQRAVSANGKRGTKTAKAELTCIQLVEQSGRGFRLIQGEYERTRGVETERRRHETDLPVVFE